MRRHLSDCRAKSITIPDSVSSVGDSAFSLCHAESIIIPEGVTSIGDYTFQGCHAESITIPGSVTSIGSCAFNACTFTSITIPEGVTNLGEKAFYGCSITSITIPSSMKSIGINAFQDCQRLESVTILPGITELGGFVFNECNSLTRVDIPVSVTNIDYNTFYNCPNVTIYGSEGSYAEQYAENSGINFASNGTYQIVLDKNGGDIDAIPNVAGAAGRFDSLFITLPTRQGWEFAGWNTEPGGTGTTITDDTVINEPLKIYAQWTVDTPAGFDDNDFKKLLAFAQQGENAAKLGWDFTKPDTWAGVTWNDAAEKRVTAIDFYSHSIYENHLIGSLDLSNFTVLAKLDCSLNDLEFLDISGCTALKELDCSDNALTSLDISSCTLLTELDCSYDDLEFLDLSGCTALVKLDCSYNTLESLDISGFSLLEELDCSYDDLEFLDLSGCTALKVLDCPYNYLTSLDVSGCTALEELGCYGNALTSLNISGCSALTYLDCEDNADLELIWGLNQLEDDINTDNTEFYSDQSLADLLAKEQAVLAVDSQIAALLDASELTLADEESVSAAEAAYNSLSAVQKTFVSNYDKLVAAKNKIIKLKGGSSRGGRQYSFRDAGNLLGWNHKYKRSYPQLSCRSGGKRCPGAGERNRSVRRYGLAG
ncbi:MAG: leucine-rich repeat protein [Syntrophomonadaceae bacterium]